MGLHPFYQHPLVQQAHVQVTVSSRSLTREEPPETDAIVEVDHDNGMARLFHNLVAIPVAVGVGHVSWSGQVSAPRRGRQNTQS